MFVCLFTISTSGHCYITTQIKRSLVNTIPTCTFLLIDHYLYCFFLYVFLSNNNNTTTTTTTATTTTNNNNNNNKAETSNASEVYCHNDYNLTYLHGACLMPLPKQNPLSEF